jgi:diguanylate cyclase (GGDEF)-like protein
MGIGNIVVLVSHMQNELAFDGFKDLIRTPLEENDPQSYERIKSIFSGVTEAPSDPFRFLIQSLTNKLHRGREAREHWRRMIRHKHDMEAKLGRRVGISAAAIDYFDVIGTIHRGKPALRGPDAAHDGLNLEESIARIYSPSYHVEILKKEMLRAKRYKHSLSAIMLDVDGFRLINERFSFKTGDEILLIIVKIIQKTVRVVDIISRYSGDRFLIILPNTNKREAMELAERLRQNIFERTKRVHGLESSGVTVTLSVGQMAGAASSLELMKHLEAILEEGKKNKRNAVYSLS